MANIILEPVHMSCISCVAETVQSFLFSIFPSEGLSDNYNVSISRWKRRVSYQEQGAIWNLSRWVSYVSSNLPSHLRSIEDTVTRILLTISSGHREPLSKLAGLIDPVEVSN